VSDAPSDALPSPSYIVGYGRPPLDTRFQPGQSGNRRGRPKGARNLATELRTVLAESVVIREGERSRKVPKLRALLTALVNRGLKGDQRAAATVVATVLRIEGNNMPVVEPTAIAAEDVQILERAMIRAMAGAPPTDAPKSSEE
jgi:hypothetical protein